MFLLVTGASGAGKSTTRQLIADQLAPEIECVELEHLDAIPPVPTIAWRQRATEAVVQRAVALQRDGRHLLLAGDPVAAGEVVAAPSADKLDAIAVCLLDVDTETQAARLARRGDDPQLFVHHHAFAGWMRAHATDPRHMLHVLSTNAWEAMRWQRLTDIDPANGGWAMHVIDSSARSPDEVARQIVAWCRRAVHGHPPAIRAVPEAEH
jgi:energy-coupling factor transporter ATP-binding protein EcfA2